MLYNIAKQYLYAKLIMEVLILKITIDVDDKNKEIEVNIKCNKLTSDVENLIATLRIINQQMLVIKDNENYLLDVNKISDKNIQRMKYMNQN